MYSKLIDLVTVMEAILMSRQRREKLECLYENVMSKDFCKTAVLKYELQTKASLQGGLKCLPMMLCFTELLSRDPLS